MPQQVTVYRLEELQAQFPAAYKAVHERWKKGIHSEPAPWSDEIMASLKAAVKACHAKLTDWSIGAYSPSYLTVDVPEPNDEDGRTDLERFTDNVLIPNKYKVGEFPGLCPFTGYCADEDFVEHVYKRLVAGDTLKDALESLADLASQFMEDDLKQMEEEESMHANWGESLFTKNGQLIK